MAALLSHPGSRNLSSPSSPIPFYEEEEEEDVAMEDVPSRAPSQLASKTKASAKRAASPNVPKSAHKKARHTKAKHSASPSRNAPSMASAASVGKAKDPTPIGSSGNWDKASGEVDPEFPFPDATVFEDYNAKLTKIIAGDKKFCWMQLLQAGNNFFLWRHIWRGVPGSDPGSDDHHRFSKQFDVPAAAVRAFEVMFKNITRNSWSQRAQFVKYPGQYSLAKADDAAAAHVNVASANPDVKSASRRSSSSPAAGATRTTENAPASVIACFFNDQQKTRALELLPEGQVTKGFVAGQADDVTIKRLRQAGLIVSTFAPHSGSSSRPSQGAAGAAGSPAASRAAVSFHSAFVPQSMMASPVDIKKPQYFLVFLKGPLLEAWRQELKALNVELLSMVPGGGLKVRCFLSEIEAVKQLPFVAKARLYDAADKAPPLLTQSSGSSPFAGKQVQMLTFDIYLHSPEDLVEVKDWMLEQKITVTDVADRTLRICVPENHPAINRIPTLRAIESVEPHEELIVRNDHARLLLGLDAAPAAAAASSSSSSSAEWRSGTVFTQTGRDQIIGVADTGIDQTHPDFAGRILEVIPMGRIGDATDPHGHGTHVAGSIVGTGAASQSRLRGVAPDARLVFQSVMDNSWKLSALPFDLTALFDVAYRKGARIHNNSWNSIDRYGLSRYSKKDGAMDRFVSLHRDMLIVVAAGNSGSCARRVHSAPGYVDWLSINSPANSKNVLTVGASRSSRSEGGYSQLTWRQYSPLHFPDDPIGQQTVSGDPNCLAGFSGRGPTDSHSIKPDVVAPGTDIVSTRSCLAPAGQFWGLYADFPEHYAHMGGTSMAAPLVSGCAALVREYYVLNRKHLPSAALLKATLINGAKRLPGDDAVAPADGEPNYHQGFGMIDMLYTIPNKARSFHLAFNDIWQPALQGLEDTGDVKKFTFNLSAVSTTLSITMAYTDLPYRGPQNQLNLLLQSPSGLTSVSNASLPESLDPQMDRNNNVQRIRLRDAEAGSYVVMVLAANLFQGPQDFALVVTADTLAGSLVSI